MTNPDGDFATVRLSYQQIEIKYTALFISRNFSSPRIAFVDAEGVCVIDRTFTRYAKYISWISYYLRFVLFHVDNFFLYRTRQRRGREEKNPKIDKYRWY